MSAPIQRLPLGLLGLLGLKNTGQNPPEFLDSVRPALEMLPFYALDIRQWNLSLSTAAQAQQTSTVLRFNGTAGPPANRVWLVSRYTVGAGAGAASTVNCNFGPGAGRYDNAGVLSGYVTVGPMATLVTAAPPVGQAQFAPMDDQLLLVPGEELTVTLGSIISAADTVSFFGTALVSEFQI